MKFRPIVLAFIGGFFGGALGDVIETHYHLVARLVALFTH